MPFSNKGEGCAVTPKNLARKAEHMKTLMTLVFGCAALLATFGAAHAEGNGAHGVMISLDEVEWQPIREGSAVDVAVLFGNPATGANVRLIRFPAGFTAPVHAHTGDYHGVVLSGTWKHWFEETGEERDLLPGSYVFQPGGEMHGDACIGPEDCVFLLQQSVAADFIPKQQ